MGAKRELRIVDPDPAWAQRFVELGEDLRCRLGPDAVRIDHIGSTSVAGLAAKDVVDVQITVAALAVADGWPDELLPGLQRMPQITRDHVPPGGSEEDADWTKRMWSRAGDIHLHVREEGRPNQRYALLFRDFLPTDAHVAAAYEAVKRELANRLPDDWDAYYAIKDPACDLVWAAANQWAQRVRWEPDPSDA